VEQTRKHVAAQRSNPNIIAKRNSNMKTATRCGLPFLAVLVFVGAVLVACRPASNKSETRLLAILPLSGNLAVIGAPKREAMLLAVEEAKKTYPDVTLTVDFQDSQGNAKDAISVLNQALATRRPDFLFIDLTPIVDATLPIVDTNHILTFAGSAQAGITKRSESMFRVFPGGDQEVQLIVKYLRSRKPKTVYVLHSNELYGRSVMQELAKYQDEVHLAGSDEYALSDKDFRTQLTKAKESGAEVIALFGYGGEYATLLRQAKELNIPSEHFVANLGGVNLGVLQLPAELTEGMVFAGPAFALRSPQSYPPQQRLVDAYVKKYNRQPDFRVAFVYDTVMLLYQALHHSKNPTDVFAQLTRINGYEGASGRIDISDSRDAVVEIVLGRYLAGKPVKLAEN
jgi:branched-chain amino acid transport system substrate-binding protein